MQTYHHPLRLVHNALRTIDRRVRDEGKPSISVWADHGRKGARYLEDAARRDLGALQCLVEQDEPHAAQKIELIERLRELLKIAPLAAIVLYSLANPADLDARRRARGRRHETAHALLQDYFEATLRAYDA